jgi:pyrimidine operon attenuation protein/uracil phosphoribosyltransferase
MGRVLARMASELIERTAGAESVVLVGIQRRGVEIADRLAGPLTAQFGATLRRGSLDITLYRDDLQAIGPRPEVRATHLPADLDGATVIIVDDVLYTGRTVRAALDEIADFGRPRRILLAVLVDRGGRELPIAADVVGLRHDTAPGDRIAVLVHEVDERDGVDLIRADAA